MISHGYESNEWLAKVVVANADPTRVKNAVISLIDVITRSEEEVSGFEIVDRLVQICGVGDYTPNDEVIGIMQEALSQADEIQGMDDYDEDEFFREIDEHLNRDNEDD